MGGCESRADAGEREGTSSGCSDDDLGKKIRDLYVLPTFQIRAVNVLTAEPLVEYIPRRHTIDSFDVRQVRLEDCTRSREFEPMDAVDNIDRLQKFLGRDGIDQPRHCSVERLCAYRPR